MKKIVFAFLFLSCISAGCATKWVPAEIYMKDDSKRESLIPGSFSINDKELKVRETKKSKTEKILSADIYRVAYINDGKNKKDGDSDYTNVYEYINYIPYKQVRSGKNKAEKNPLWAKIEMLGTVSVYSYWHYVGNASFKAYLVKRADEPAATTLIFGYAFYNEAAAKYFSDYPELAKKIAGKEKGYAEGSNLGEIVNEYNSEKGDI